MTRPTLALLVATMLVLAGGLAVTAVRLVAGDPLAGFTEHTDDAAGFRLSYPSTWERLESSDPQVSLVATPNGLDSLLVRVVDLTVAVDDPAGLEQARSFTGELVTSGTGVEVVAGPNEVELGGLPGWYYLYRFQDEVTGLQGVHSHYFLFREDTMVVLVFQGLPEPDFRELAPTFDRIADSFTTIEPSTTGPTDG